MSERALRVRNWVSRNTGIGENETDEKNDPKRSRSLIITAPEADGTGDGN